MPTTERLARLAAHNAQVEQLAQEIIKYRVMMDIPGDILIGIMEIRTRFTESPDDVREAFRLLAGEGRCSTYRVQRPLGTALLNLRSRTQSGNGLAGPALTVGSAFQTLKAI